MQIKPLPAIGVTTSSALLTSSKVNKSKLDNVFFKSFYEEEKEENDKFIKKSESKNIYTNVKPPFWGGFLVSFTGGVDIRKLWIKGLLPTVKKGFYGDTLTLENITREHLLPASKGGKRTFSNIVLASAKNNSARSNYDINLFANSDIVKEYLGQFKDVKLQRFNGKKYIEAVIKTLETLGFKL